MKKVGFLAIYVIAVIFMFLLSSCEKPVTTTQTTTVTKVTTSEPGSDGFLIGKQLVIKGNTVWGFSREQYGTGIQWREIVAQNPFLQQPGRVYWNEARQRWIVKIYPGEVIRIGGQFVSPTVTVEETTTTTVEKTADDSFFTPVWLFWIIVAGALIIILIFNLINHRNNTANANAEVHVNMKNGCDIDLATEKALLAQKQVFWTDALIAADRDSLSFLSIHLDSENFDLDACFDNKKPEIKTEQKTKEDKKK